MGDGGVRGGHGDGGGARGGEDGEEWRGEGGEERGGEGGEERGGRYGGGVRGEGGGGRGSQEDLGPHQCQACRRDLGDTRALFLHLQTGGGHCLAQLGLTFDQFRRQYRLEQKRSNARRQVSPGWG